MMKLTNLKFTNSFYGTWSLVVAIVIFLALTSVSEAASLALSQSTGVYSSNSTFTVRVQVNTEGQSVNAAEGTISFNPKELSVVSVNRSGSIFSLWVAEPAFSNSAGTISFSGGLPSGYSGKTGTIMNITFRAAGAGTARVNFKNGSVLANDGRGTNILTNMNGGVYTIQANAVAPEPEIIEYVAPANTPSAPTITSSTHSDSTKWYASNSATLNWVLPSGVTGVRTLLNDNPTSVPTRVYDEPISSINLTDLEEGISYFHIQFRNSEGWGRVTHYRLAVDTKNPLNIKIENLADLETSNPNQILKVQVEDETSVVNRYIVKLNNQPEFDYLDETGSSTIILPALDPGYHTVIIEAFDQAGNSIVGTHSFTIASFDKPVFTEYPAEINEQVIPVIKGLTRPESVVEISLTRLGSEPIIYTITADNQGEFIFIPEGKFSNGVYELVARATDKFGAQSEYSDSIKIAVQQAGYLRIGSLIVSVLSVLVPLLVLLFLLVIGSWYLYAYAKRFKKKVRVESSEALEILNKEFATLQNILSEQSESMLQSRKTKKLTKAEEEMVMVINEALQKSRAKVEKEINDVTELTNKPG